MKKNGKVVGFKLLHPKTKYKATKTKIVDITEKQIKRSRKEKRKDRIKPIQMWLTILDSCTSQHQGVRIIFQQMRLEQMKIHVL